MEGFEKNDELNEEMDGKFKQEVYSKAVRAGKRTYFFDVKSTRKDEYYLTITESKKHYDQDGRYRFEKHKIFLYKEDFEKFADGLNEVMEFIGLHQGFDDYEQAAYEEQEEAMEVAHSNKTDFEDEEAGEELYVKDYTNVEFEDLSN